MDESNNILKKIYLYFLSLNNFNNNNKKNTTFKCLISLFILKFNSLYYYYYYYYLLINLIIYLIKINLSRFNKNSLILNFYSLISINIHFKLIINFFKFLNKLYYVFRGKTNL